MKPILPILVIVFSFVNLVTNAQLIQFQEVLPQSPTPTNLIDFDYVAQGETAFADIDGDGDEDVLITGSTSYVGFVTTIARLYINDGVGNYSLVQGTPFSGVRLGTVDFADVDGDSDLDVLITGQNTDGGVIGIAKLYLNDGNGNFTVLSGTPFEPVALSSTEFADIDGDSDLDVLITGLNMSNIPVSNLYINDGSGNYTLDPSTPFEDVEYGSVAFADVDNDADLDLVISGLSGTGEISKLYLNDGSGVFTEDVINSFVGVGTSSIAFADIDNDSDQDLLITGLTSSSQSISKLYLNNSLGVFTEDTSVPFSGVWIGSISISDFDGDNDNDILITGEDIGTGSRLTELYLNDGVGNFTIDNSSWFESAAWSSVTTSDIDGDNDLDLLITGRDDFNHSFTRLYVNDGNALFAWASRVFNDGVEDSSTKFGDIDGDGDQDLIVTGAPSLTTDQGKTELYINDGLGYYTKVDSVPFDGLTQGDVEFLDIENDGDLDLIITGWGGMYVGAIAKLYENDGNGIYTEITSTPFTSVIFSHVAVADIDNDNDIDIVISGRNSSNDSSTKLYVNDGNGNFTFQSSNLIAVHQGTMEFADIDNDNDLDVFISGYSSVAPFPSSYEGKMYLNDGNGGFDEIIGLPIEGVNNSDAKFADMDGDGDLDLLVSGFNGTSNSTKLYENLGFGNFAEVTGISLPQIYQSSILFKDLDGDNAPDILISGADYPLYMLELFKNDGLGNFSPVSITPFNDVGNGSISATDIDGDLDLDILITGRQRQNYAISKLYRNTTTVGLTEPNKENEIKIYPNPTNSIITIQFTNQYNSVDRIEIRDYSGKLISTQKDNWMDNQIEVDLSELARGIYFVHIFEAESVIVKKVVRN